MSLGKQFLASLLTTGEQQDRIRLLRQATDLGVNEKFFELEDDRNAFEFVRRHFLRYAVLPSLAVVEVETDIRFPHFRPPEPFSYWLDEMQRRRLLVMSHGYAEEIQRLTLEGNVTGMRESAQEFFTELSRTGRRNEVKTYSEMLTEVVEQHNLLRSGAVESGIPVGFRYIDTVTGGAQPGDSWVIAGRPGTGKTYVMCRAAMEAYNAGRRVLFVSMEMPRLQIAVRNAALGAVLSSTHIRLGRMSEFALAELNRYVHEQQTNGRDPESFVLYEGRLNVSVDDVMLKVREYRPDVLFVDGAYMLRPSGKSFGSKANWEVAMQVMLDLKQLAMNENIPVISSYQFNRGGDKKGIEGLAYTDAVGQLASVVLGLTNDSASSERIGVEFKLLELLKGRQGERGKVRLRYDMVRTSIEESLVLEGDRGLLDEVAFEPELEQRDDLQHSGDGDLDDMM
jgi:replicative DNA helicase